MGISIGFGFGPVRVSSSLRAPRYRTPSRPRTVYVAQPIAQSAVQPVTPSPVSRALGIIAVMVVAPFLVLLQIGMFGAHGFWGGMIWLLAQLIVATPFVIARVITQRDKARDEITARQAAAAARADYEHNALMRGDMAVGIHGAFQPKC